MARSGGPFSLFGAIPGQTGVPFPEIALAATVRHISGMLAP
jgi:hypothetical protein